MMVRDPWIRHALAALCVAAAACRTTPTYDTIDTAQDSGAERSRVVLSHALPRLDGGHLEVSIVEVTYGPGGSSSPHSHPCPVVGYVIEGVLRTQVKGGPEAIYQPGESFYEQPNGVHVVSANASDEQPVRFLAYFTCDHPTPLSVPSTMELNEEDS
jgi:quercetin dioxygenase-like cupin family protein